MIFTDITSKINLRELELLDFISDHWFISVTIDIKKALLRITKKKIRNLREVDLATVMENFQQPEQMCTRKISQENRKATQTMVKSHPMWTVNTT